MKVTVDANVLFACLIKDSVTRRLFFNPTMSIFAPAFIIDEYIKYAQELQKKSKLPEWDFLQLVNDVLGQVSVVPNESLKLFLPAAEFLISDSKDWLYIACALSEDTVIWSNDLGFKSQSRIKVFTTKELIDQLSLL